MRCSVTKMCSTYTIFVLLVRVCRIASCLVAFINLVIGTLSYTVVHYQLLSRLYVLMWALQPRTVRPVLTVPASPSPALIGPATLRRRLCNPIHLILLLNLCLYLSILSLVCDDNHGHRSRRCYRHSVFIGFAFYAHVRLLLDNRK